jgi:hypothetical protein
MPPPCFRIPPPHVSQPQMLTMSGSAWQWLCGAVLLAPRVYAHSNRNFPIP